MDEKPTKTVNLFGTIKYRLDGKLHRDDGPAVMFAEGGLVWHNHGSYHRLDGPSIIAESQLWWYLYGYAYTREDYIVYLLGYEHNKTVLPEKLFSLIS